MQGGVSGRRACSPGGHMAEEGGLGIALKSLMSAFAKVFSTAVVFGSNVLRDPFRPDGERFGYLRRWLRLNYCWINRRPSIPTRFAAALAPGLSETAIPLEVSFKDWNLTPLELFYVCALAGAVRPRRVFEFGTFDGNTTLHLARNCPEAELWTLDLPDPENHFRVGSRFAGRPEAARIHQIRADSRVHDFSEHRGRMEFILIDAGHEYDCVAADTRNALAMAAPDATILWHDYLSFEGVKRAVDETAVSHPVVHIAGTELAVLQMGAHRVVGGNGGSSNTMLNDQLAQWLPGA